MSPRLQIGGDFRRGALDVDGHEVVGGMVVMRTGENAHAGDRAREREDRADRAELAAGRDASSRSTIAANLIDRTIETLKHALIEEIILVTLRTSSSSSTSAAS